VNGRILPIRPLVWVGIGLCLLGGALIAQAPQQTAPPLPRPVNQEDDPILRSFIWRSIGPATMGGRIDDIAVDESNPSTFYLALATGGIWKTTNNGITWAPIFDEHPVASIGDMALAPSDPNIIYVGTGEPNNRQSSSFGNGMYKSTDAGKTFTHIGLDATQTIARIVVHPRNPDIAYVAAVGHLFGPNLERGLYKTSDGGKTWTNTRFIDEDTGFTDVAMDPSNPNVLLAASYQRRRQPWGFNGGGPGSGIWKTTDGARTWTKLTGNGLPDNPIIGRIGLDISRTRPQTIYASIEVGPSGGTGAGVNDDGTLVQPGQGRGGGGRGAQAPPDPTKSGIWRSDDGGKNWKFLSNQGDRWMYYSKIRIDPTNPEIAYQGGAPFFKTVDGGRTWTALGGIPHSDHHAFWINPRNNNHIILGNDGGLDMSYDQGATWEFINTMPLGQFYAVSADMRKPYYVCGGLQDNGSWCGPSATRRAAGILNADWFRIGGGDGFYTQNDPTEWATVYWESQDGNTSRTDLRAGRSTAIRPRPAAGGGRGGAPAPPNVVPVPPSGTNYRFYWSTPFILSPHNPRTVYLGAERLFRSYDRGDTWTASPDLTNNIGRNDRPIMGVAGTAPMASKHDGAASFSNIITISESPVLPGVLWVGTNDGNVQVSRDGGATWKNVAGNVTDVPKETYVSRVEASPFDPMTAYVSFDGHRTDDHKPYVFVTRDLGETWTSIAANLPAGNVNVIKADPKNRNLLYVGTEYGFYVSLDGGGQWKRFMNGLPTVRVDDVMVHPRDNDLILGTHGRSIWIMDDITALQQLSAETLGTEAAVLDVRPATVWLTDIQKAILVEGAKHYRGQNPPRGTAISYWLKAAATGPVRLSISDVTGTEIRSITGTPHAGLNRIQWDLAPAGGRGGRGAGAAAGGQGAAGAGAPPAQPAAAAATPGQQGQPAPATAAQPVEGAAQPAAVPAGARGGGRGGPAPPVPPGSYLVKVFVGDKVISQKTIVVEPDVIQ
jgi:photosystem II stability/assembly factor-like uncharacterized protein